MRITDSSFRLREKADYDDFVIISFSAAEEQLAKAREVISMVQAYLERKWENLRNIPEAEE